MDVKAKDAKNTKEDSIAELLDGVTVNISQLHDRLALALMIVGNANVQVAQLHHDNFKQYIHCDYQELLHHTNPQFLEIIRKKKSAIFLKLNKSQGRPNQARGIGTILNIFPVVFRCNRWRMRLEIPQETNYRRSQKLQQRASGQIIKTNKACDI